MQPVQHSHTYPPSFFFPFLTLLSVHVHVHKEAPESPDIDNDAQEEQGTITSCQYIHYITRSVQPFPGPC